MHSTEAIVLKKMDVGEHDALYMLYTRDYGKMKAVAAGIKKEGAKLKGHLEPLSMSGVRFVSGKNREKLIAASLMNFWHGLRADEKKLAAAHYVASRIDQECMEGEKDDGLWGLITKNLFTLDTKDILEEELERFLHSFETDLRECLGYGGANGVSINEVSSGRNEPDYAIMNTWVSWRN